MFSGPPPIPTSPEESTIHDLMRRHTAPARLALREKFERLADPDNVLSPSERAKRAGALRREYYARIGRIGVAARRARKQAREVTA